MTTTLQATIQGYDVRATLDKPHPFGRNARAHAFAPDSADIAAETRTRTFNGYCPAEIFAQLAAEMMPWADPEAIDDDLAAAGFTCTCPCDCGECDDCERDA